MINKIRKFILILLVVLILILVTMWGYESIFNKNEKLEDNVWSINNKDKIVKLESIMISDISTSANDKYSDISIKVFNDSGEDIDIQSFSAIVKDKNSKVLGEVVFYGGYLKKGCSFLSSSDIDISLEEIYYLDFESLNILEGE